MIIGPFTFQSREGMQSFQMLNHAISPCNIIFKKTETMVFSIQGFIHCIGPALLSGQEIPGQRSQKIIYY